MRLWPSPSSDWLDWAESLIQTLVAFEQDLVRPTGVGQIGEFIQLPSGWLACDGATFSAESYPALNQILGGNTLPNLTPAYDSSYIVGIKAG